NPYFILEPGYYLTLEKGSERHTVTVLDETKTVDGVETRVVVESETKDGKPVEISRNYSAISKRTGDVYYFGEHVDIYKDGKVVSHKGSWLSGVKGAKFGLMMPGKVRLKTKFYQEQAPGAGMDRAECVRVSETVKTPTGASKAGEKFEEPTPLEPETKDYKYYAAGVGLVQDGEAKLVKYGFKGKKKVPPPPGAGARSSLTPVEPGPAATAAVGVPPRVAVRPRLARLGGR